MQTELICLAWAAVLGLVHIFAAAHVKTRQYGTKWNVGARDETLPLPEPVVGRLMRAQANFFETFPIFAVAALIAVLSGRTGSGTASGAVLYLFARIVYLPLYAAGVPVLRTIVFGLSLVGIVLVLWPALFG